MASEFEDHFDLFLPKELNMTDQGMRQQAGDMIKKLYFDGKKVDSSTEMHLIDVTRLDFKLGDSTFYKISTI